MIDTAGNATALSYDAFGLEIGNATTNVNHRYTGEYFDQESGLYHLRARDYDPVIGRFISMDEHPGTQIIPLTLNKYLYGNADPVNGVDPSGNETLPGLMSALGSAGNSFAVASYHAVLRAIQFGAGRTISAGIYQKIRLATAALASKLIGPATQLMRRCARNLDTCIPDFNVFIVGDTTPEHRAVVTTALENGAPFNLSYYKAGHDRKWLISDGKCRGSRDGVFTDCDEYPYASSYEGGKNNAAYTTTQVIAAADNQHAGRMLGAMYRVCKIQDKERFNVIPLANDAGVPIPTSYLCHNGNRRKKR